MEDRKNAIGRNIANLRKENGWKQSQLASKVKERLGKTATTTISFYEQGRREPNADTLIALADVLGTTTDYLVGRTSDPIPPAQSINDLTGLDAKAIAALMGMQKTGRAIEGINRILPSEKAESFFSAIEKHTDGWSTQQSADMFVLLSKVGDNPIEISEEDAYQNALGQSKMFVHNALDALLEDITLPPRAPDYGDPGPDDWD